MLGVIRGASRYSAEARSTRGAALCLAKAHFDRRSLSVLSPCSSELESFLVLGRRLVWLIEPRGAWLIVGAY